MGCRIVSVDIRLSQPPSLVRLLVERAERLAHLGRWVDARALFTAAMTADPTPAARIAFGVFLADRDFAEEAISQLMQAWEEAKLREMPEARAICCQNLSALYRRQGNIPLAIQFQQLATAAEMESHRFREDASLSCPLLTSSAGLLSDCDELDAALRLLRAAEVTSGGDQPIRATIEANLGVTLARMGRTGQALQRLVRAQRLHRESGDLAGCAHDLVNIGHLLQARARRVEAHRCFRLAGELFSRLNATIQAHAAQQYAQEALRIEAIETCDPSLN